MLFGKLKKYSGITSSTTVRRIKLILKNYPDLSESSVKTIQGSLLLSTVCYIAFLTQLLKEREKMCTSSIKTKNTPNVK